MKYPVLILNLKVYEEATGENAVRKAKAAELVSQESGINIIVAVSAPDIYRVSKAVKIPVFAQHVDGNPPGAFTGSVTPEAIRSAGGAGSLINHSEKTLLLSQIKSAVQRCKNAGLTAVVCAEDDKEAITMASCGPDMVAIEPRELVSGNVSVTDAKPDIIANAARKVRIPLLCGAGVKTARDVKKAMELGCKGVLVASGFAKAEDPLEYLRDLVTGFG